MIKVTRFWRLAAFLVGREFIAGISDSSAEEWKVVLNPEESALNFELGSTLHTVHGAMNLVSGDLTFDSETGQASGLIRVDAQAIETGNGKRDKKMHEVVLESEKYPLFEYRVEHVEGDFKAEGNSELELVGTLSIHGSEHPLVVPVEVRNLNGKITVIARFMIPFVEWGMKDPSVFIFRVDKEVAVHIEVNGSLAAGEV